ncbi:DUF4287 domain-containing protein [Amycolatopsis sp. cmx-4-68]|uniref:DUF4287 domain-containing protein n=1 Tax=Amycolatopsis sp. cmx-4-68 TaxID=2790938 RepID=UPI00397D695D
MSFQAYLDNAEKQTGLTPRAFLDLAAERNLTKHGEIVTWLKTEHGLGHGHATAIARLVTKGPSSSPSTTAKACSTSTAWPPGPETRAARLNRSGRGTCRRRRRACGR